MNSVPKLFSCSYADCWTEKHFSTEFGVLTPNHTHSHTLFWGCVSRWFGRALAWHARGHRFDPGNLHQKEKHYTETCGAFFVKANRVRVLLNRESAVHGLQEGHRDYNSPVISTRTESTAQRCVVLFVLSAVHLNAPFHEKSVCRCPQAVTNAFYFILRPSAF